MVALYLEHEHEPQQLFFAVDVLLTSKVSLRE